MTLARMHARLKPYIMEMILLVICTTLAIAADNFFTKDNFLNILRGISMQGVIAFGMTMVIIAGEIDLSVASTVACSGCLMAWLTETLTGPSVLMPMSVVIPLAALAAMAAGFGVGSLTGFLRVRFGVPTFITTLAWLTFLRGSALKITGGFAMTPFPDWYNFFGGGYVLGIPFPAIVFLLVFAAIQFVMSFTVFGREIYAVGGNVEAARLSGIRVNRVKILVMGIVAGLAALSGLMLSSQISSGTPGAAVGWELDIIAAVIIGGTSLMGGSGKVWGTMIGMVFLGVLGNGMVLLNIKEDVQLMARGALILIAVLFNVAPTTKK
jgi:ribose/xylose/arabinose/galactoside ABC-type transport system permease subunit